MAETHNPVLYTNLHELQSQPSINHLSPTQLTLEESTAAATVAAAAIKMSALSMIDEKLSPKNDLSKNNHRHRHKHPSQSSLPLASASQCSRGIRQFHASSPSSPPCGANGLMPPPHRKQTSKQGQKKQKSRRGGGMYNKSRLM